MSQAGALSNLGVGKKTEVRSPQKTHIHNSFHNGQEVKQPKGPWMDG